LIGHAADIETPPFFQIKIAGAVASTFALRASSRESSYSLTAARSSLWRPGEDGDAVLLSFLRPDGTPRDYIIAKKYLSIIFWLGAWTIKQQHVSLLP